MKILLLILFSFLNAFGQANLQDTINYKIKPVSADDRTDLEISVDFNARKGKSFVIKLPTDNYGTPDIHKYVTSFEGKNGTNQRTGEQELERIVEPNSEGKVSLKYIISYDPKKLEGSAFAPITDQHYFSVAGCQWLLHIGDDKQKTKFTIEMIDPPEGWIVHSSIGENAKRIKTVANYNDLISSRIGGGGNSHKFFVRNKPVSVFINGKFNITKERMFSAVERIVRLQRDWFADYDQPFYQVVINQRGGIVAGTAVENEFVCFVRSDVEEDDLNIILAHEMFHNWLPHSVEIEIPKGDLDVRHEWFSEGFTTYFAKKILLDAGLLSPEKFAELVNEEIRYLADNPMGRATYDELVLAVKNRNFTSEHKGLAYRRGALIALNWEARLRNSKSKTNLSEFIRALYKFAGSKGGKLSEGEFFDFAESRGIKAKSDFEKHILRGEQVDLQSDVSKIIGEEFELSEIDYQSFEPDFDYVESRQSGKISGVVEGGKAFRAGLRNGMEYVKMQNYRREKGWSAERKMIITAKDNGEEKKFEFVPHGKLLKLMQIAEK